MTRLAERLDEFALALLDPERAVPKGLVGPDGEPSARRFAVYRNNVFVGLTDALRAGFPCIVRLVGDDFFAAMARVFAAATPPSSPVLRSEEHTSELQSLMRISYAVFCLKKKQNHK